MVSHSPQGHIAPPPNRTRQRACILGTSRSILFRVFWLQIVLFSDSFMASCWYFFKKKYTPPSPMGEIGLLNYLAFGHMWPRVSWSFTVGTEAVNRGNCGGLSWSLDALLVSELNPGLGGSRWLTPHPCRSHSLLCSHLRCPTQNSTQLVYYSVRHAAQRHLFRLRPQ